MKPVKPLPELPQRPRPEIPPRPLRKPAVRTTPQGSEAASTERPRKSQPLEKAPEAESTRNRVQPEARQSLTKRKSSSLTTISATQQQGPPSSQNPQTLPTAQRPLLRPQIDVQQFRVTTAPHRTPLEHTNALNELYGVNYAKVEAMKSVWLQAALKLLNSDPRHQNSLLVSQYQKGLSAINDRIALGKVQKIQVRIRPQWSRSSPWTCHRPFTEPSHTPWEAKQ